MQTSKTTMSNVLWQCRKNFGCLFESYWNTYSIKQKHCAAFHMALCLWYYPETYFYSFLLLFKHKCFPIVKLLNLGWLVFPEHCKPCSVFHLPTLSVRSCMSFIPAVAADSLLNPLIWATDQVTTVWLLSTADWRDTSSSVIHRM